MPVGILELLIVNYLFKIFFPVHTVFTDIQKKEQSPIFANE